MTKRARRPAEAEAEAEAPVAVTVANEHLEDVHEEEDEAPVAATPRKKAAPRITKKAASTAKKGATAKDDSSARGAAKRTRLTKLADWEEGAAQVAVTVADEHLADSKDEDAVVVSEQLGKVKEEEPVAAPVVRRIPKRNISSAARTAAAEKDAEREATAIRAKQEHETALAAAPITADDLPAAFNPPNVNQVYLRRAVLEEIATRPKVNQVIKGLYARVPLGTGEHTKDSAHRLMRVETLHKTDKGMLLEVLNMRKVEKVPLAQLSNHDFTDEECAKLRDAVVSGVHPRLSKREMRELATSLAAALPRESVDACRKRLIALRDLANMQGHTKDIKAIKQQLDQLDRTGLAPTIRIKPPEIEIDRTLGDKSKSPSGRGGRGFNSGREFTNNTQRRPSFESPRVPQNAPWLTAEQQYQQQQRSSPSPHALHNAGLHNNNNLKPHQPNSSPRPHNPHSGRPVVPSSSPFIPQVPPPTGSNHVQPHRPFSPQPQQHSPVQELLQDSPFSPPQSPLEADTSKPQSGMRRSAELELHYRDPKGKEHGPFKLQELEAWYARGLFPKDLCVWRGGQIASQAVPLASLLDPGKAVPSPSSAPSAAAAAVAVTSSSANFTATVNPTTAAAATNLVPPSPSAPPAPPPAPPPPPPQQPTLAHPPGPPLPASPAYHPTDALMPMPPSNVPSQLSLPQQPGGVPPPPVGPPRGQPGGPPPGPPPPGPPPVAAANTPPWLAQQQQQSAAAASAAPPPLMPPYARTAPFNSGGNAYGNPRMMGMMGMGGGAPPPGGPPPSIAPGGPPPPALPHGGWVHRGPTPPQVYPLRDPKAMPQFSGVGRGPPPPPFY